MELIPLSGENLVLQALANTRLSHNKYEHSNRINNNLSLWLFYSHCRGHNWGYEHPPASFSGLSELT